MKHSKGVKEEVDEYLKAGGINEAREFLLAHFQGLKANNNIGATEFKRESDYLLETVLKVIR